MLFVTVLTETRVRRDEPAPYRPQNARRRRYLAQTSRVQARRTTARRIPDLGSPAVEQAAAAYHFALHPRG